MDSSWKIENQPTSNEKNVKMFLEVDFSLKSYNEI